MTNFEVWCPTCHKLCNDFGDLLQRDGYAVHKVCGKIPITRVKGFKRKI